ncbi:hypothetical protein [Nitrospira sp. Nam80]
MRTRLLPPVPALFLFRVFVVFHVLGMPAAIGCLAPDLLRADERDTGTSGRAVSGRVLRSPGRPEYSSEVMIYFWDSIALGEGRHDLADVIEFHAVEQGKPTASMEEIEVWIGSALQDVCDRRRAG